MFPNNENLATKPAAGPAGKSAEPPAPNSAVALKERKIDGEPPKVLDEVLIEEVSIDGMCGVY